MSPSYLHFLHLGLYSEVWHRNCFERGQVENIRFWSRFDVKPDLKGQTVLDIGCGHGRLCLEMAMAGAKKVVGIDVNVPMLDFARRNLQLRYPELQSVVSFECCEIDTLPNNVFDFIVSKDTFEHIFDLRGLLGNIRRCLKPGGRLYAGFGPLYHAPNGYHRMPHFGLPWGHLFVPRSLLLLWNNRGNKEICQSFFELYGLNELSFANYETIFAESGLEMISFWVNQSEHFMSRILTLLRKTPILRKYCTHNIYCILEKSR